jgi:glycosyltransferase involved in cell wall biosynthesis
MSAEYPFVQVVVVAKNEEKHIQRCLDSLKGLDYPKDRYEVIAIDGCSMDKTVDIARNNGIKVIVDEAGGLAHSRNLGLSVASGEYIASTDADCIVKDDWLKKRL